jgi:hypothetical protein
MHPRTAPAATAGDPRHAKRVATSKRHAAQARDAAAQLTTLLANPTADPAEMLRLAKVLEAAGCYIRRTVA